MDKKPFSTRFSFQSKSSDYPFTDKVKQLHRYLALKKNRFVQSMPLAVRLSKVSPQEKVTLVALLVFYTSI
jgi:hypothetical protein